MLRKYTTLLMDADNTIFDFGKCEYNALHKTLDRYDLQFNEVIYQNFTRINSRLWTEFEKNCITRSELRVRRFRELIEKCFDGFDQVGALAEEYIDRLSEQAILIDGAYEAVEKLSHYFEMYIITNGLKKVQRGRFAKTSISKYFKKLFISDEINVQKPRKEFFEYVINNIDEKKKERILVVGDSLTSDMQGGKNGGLDTCLYDPGNKISMPNELCDYKISDLNEILKISSEEGI